MHEHQVHEGRLKVTQVCIELLHRPIVGVIRSECVIRSPFGLRPTSAVKVSVRVVGRVHAIPVDVGINLRCEEEGVSRVLRELLAGLLEVCVIYGRINAHVAHIKRHLYNFCGIGGCYSPQA